MSRTPRTLISGSALPFQELGATVKRLAGSVPYWEDGFDVEELGGS